VEQAKAHMSSGRGRDGGSGSEFPSAALTGLWGGRWAASGMGRLRFPVALRDRDGARLRCAQCDATYSDRGNDEKVCTVPGRCTQNDDGEDDYAYTHYSTTLIFTRRHGESHRGSACRPIATGDPYFNRERQIELETKHDVVF
jgi:hypothetical protein